MKKSHVRQNIDFYDLHFEAIQKEKKERKTENAFRNSLPFATRAKRYNRDKG